MTVKFKLLTFGSLVGLVGLITYPAEAAEAVRNSLRLCGMSVIPALFPFFVLTKFWLACRPPKHTPQWLDRWMQRLFGVGGNGFSALLLSFMGGYPVGVSTAVSLYENGALSKHEAERLIRFCNNSGPAFFVGIIGGVVLRSVRLGLWMFAAHIAAAICCGLLFAEKAAPSARMKRITQTPPPMSEAFLGAIGASCASLLQISGLIISFSVAIALLEACGFFSALCSVGLPAQEFLAILNGVLELSSGVLRLEGSVHAPVIAAFLMGWGGLCVHMQAMGLWKSAKLRPKGYFLSKLAHGLISALFMQTVLSPTPLFLLCSVGCVGICVLFSCVSKKRGGNLRKFAV